MGMQSAQAAQPISQQQPSQGKSGFAGAPVNPPSANFQQTDDYMEAPMQPMPARMPNPMDPESSQTDQNNSFMPQHQGKGSGKSGGMGSTTNSATSGQPRMGQPNPYPNTIQPWDNSNIQPQTQSGKGKGH
jgi:hypothetical protein